MRIVYVESFCRVEHLSLTGEILYKLHLTDKFYVQWESLADKFPRSEFIGRLV